MKNQRSFTKNKVDNSTESSLNGQKFGSATRSRSPVVTGSASLYSLPVGRARSQNQHFWSSFKLVPRRLFFKKKDVLGLYSYKPRVFLRTLLSRWRGNQSKLSFVKESLAKKTSKKTELKVNSNSVLNNYNKGSSNYIKNYINNSRNIRMAGIAASFALVLMGAATIAPLYNKTNSAEATVGNEVPADTKLEITTSSNVAGVDLLVTDGNGTSASSDKSGNTLGFNVTTNNYTGYTLTIASPDTATYNNGKLTNTDTTNCTDVTKCVLNTISSASGTISANGTWGYKPSKLNSATNSNYLPSPTTTATTLNATACANGTSPCNNANDAYTIDIAARADYTQPAGVYSNTYILQAVGNDISYKISFASYTSDVTDAVSNLPTALADSVSATKINLTNDKTPTRTGYTFSKWCLGTTSSNGTVCNGTTYEVGTASNPKYFGIDQTVDNSNITLYAVWTINKNNLVISADSNVSSMSVKAGSASGTETSCTKSGTTFTCANLTYGINYYLYPVFASGYEFNSWAKTDSATNAALGSTTAVNTYYKMGNGAGALTLTSKSSGYTITYNANNGTGSIASQTVNAGSSVTLADNAYTRSNYYFKGWATSASGSVVYRTNQTITPTSNMTLYAVWGSSTSTSLYNIVASLTRGNQTNDTNATTGIQTAITKANSGVYTYNASVFGTASDASTSNPIYYYRGILDKTTGTYGSDGDAMDYPNYVKLGITCWRIVRTTGSGGVKMIYNGMYGNTTSGSCANNQAAAQIRATSATAADSTATFTSVFDTTANSSGKSIVGVGYTYNASYKSTTAATAYSTLFGSNTSYSGNSTNSTIKGNIETWFGNNINSYASKLEPSAGYCNDRTLNTGTSWTNPMSDSTTVSTPYSSASSGNTAYYFGAYIRNVTTTKAPSLTCARNNADLYTTSSASNGNKQLGKPVALLTADEVSFAGSGRSTASQGSSYHANSYLRSGSVFWLLSPYYRVSNGGAREFALYSGGDLDGGRVYITYGVRPAISLTSGTTPTSGSGTATDPWVVQ